MKLRTVKIGNKTVGGESPCYTIAEAGANHDGTVEKFMAGHLTEL